MSQRNFLLSLLFLALSLMVQVGFAQTVPFTAMPSSANPNAAMSAVQSTASQQKAGSFFANLQGSVTQFNNRLNVNLGQTMKNYGRTQVAPLVQQPALALGGSLALIYLLLESIQFMAGNRNSMVTVLFDIGIPCCFAVLLINGYDGYIQEFDKILDVFRMSSLGTNPTSQLMSVYGSILAQIGKAIGSLFLNIINPAEFITSPGSWISSLADFLATIIFTLVVLYLVLEGIAEVMGLLLLGPFLTAIGMAFGPLLIVGLVTPWTTDYFKKWVQFMVVSAAVTGVINVILAVAGSLLGSSGLGIDGLTGDNPTAAGMIIVVVLLLTVNSLISQAPQITSALMPGSLGAHRGASEGVKKAAGKSGNNAKSGTKKVGKQAVKAVKKIYSKGMG